jgi:DNA invertase Pin-like site-specific DNA recombinase
MTDAPHLVGYARVSTDDQSLALQIDALIGNGVSPDAIHTDKASGKSLAKRPGLRQAFQDLRRGDILVVWKLDRLGRNLEELITTVKRIEECGAHFRCLTQPIDTSTPMGLLVFHIFGAMAQFERELARERTMAGLAAAAARGRKGGRRPSLSNEKADRARAMLAAGARITDVVREVGVARSTIYKWREEEARPPVDDPAEELTDDQ